MDIKFFSGGKILNLSKQKISVQENNSKVNDKVFSKYMFPFEIYMDEEFKTSFGDYESYESYDLSGKIEGTLLFENKLHDAILYIESIEGNFLTGQIDFGFEDLPNWDKKLSELPLLKFTVPDIHIHAKEICAKKWPQTNYNFPRIYTTKYSPDNKVWDAFNGYLNDLKPDGSEMFRNYVDGAGNIFNQNIIHPCPHPIYLLKAGFLDAGLILKGEVLTDPMLQNKFIYSGTEYFVSKKQIRLGFNFSTSDSDSMHILHYTYTTGGVNGTVNNGYATFLKYNKTIVLPKKGTYKISGSLRLIKFMFQPATYKLFCNGNLIWSKEYKGSDFPGVGSIGINLDFYVADDNSNLTLFIDISKIDGTQVLADLLVTSSALEDVNNEELGDDSGFVTNPNEIDLSRAVPDMTWGEYINVWRNWLNYDYTIKDNEVWMNRLDKDPENIKDCRHFEVKTPKRVLLTKRSFQIKPAEIDGDAKLNFMYYDRDGALLNKEGKMETTVIDFNGYELPIEKAKTYAHLTASIKKDSTDCVALVDYSGLDSGGQNNATYDKRIMFPELFYSNWEKWLRRRVFGTQFIWKFLIKADDLDVEIKDDIYLYNKEHIITSWTKDLQENTYEIEITTESTT